MPFIIGPFTAKSKTRRDIFEELKEMKFKVGVKMHYDPHHIILERRVQEKFLAYENEEN